MTPNIPITEIQARPQHIRLSHHVEYVQIDFTVVPAKFSFAIQRAKSTGNKAANQNHCTYELLSVSIAQLNRVL